LLLTRNLKLDFTNKEITTIGLNRYDQDSREYIITFTDENGIVNIDYLTNTAYIMMLKPDNTKVLLRGTINTDGTVTVLFDNQMTAAAGVGYLQIKILNNDTNEVIHTVLLKVVIGASAYDEKDVMSSDEFKALSDFLDEAEDLIDEIERQVALAQEAATLSESWAVGGTDTREGEDTNNSMYYSQQSSNFADNSEASAVRSESWAVGGTNTRAGEDTNNSMYYSGVSSDYATNSQSWAIGGTNTRTGEDTNNSQYFSGVSSDYATNSQSWAIGGTNTRTGEDTNNAKYYSEQSSDYADTSSDYATNSQSWAVGSTGTRTGEDTNNAKYYSEQSSDYADTSSDKAVLAESWAIGNTGTRTGEDTNNAAYYSDLAHTYANAAASSEGDADVNAILSQSWAIGGTGTRAGEDTNNSMYYSGQSSASATNSANSAILSESWAIGGTNTRTGEDTNNAMYYASVNADMVANPYDNTSTYELGDYVTYNYVLYRNKTAISTPEDFDSTKWDAVKVVDAISSFNVINDATKSFTTTYSSEKIEDLISHAGGVSIDDVNPSTTTAFSGSHIMDLINSASLANNVFDVYYTDWGANADTETSTDYPYVTFINTDKYSDDSKPIWQIAGANDVITSYEVGEANKISVAYFDSTGIILYAKDLPFTNLKLEVKGVN